MNFTNPKEMQKHFEAALGDTQAVMFSSDTGRPYVLIAKKGDIKLLVNFAIEKLDINGEDKQYTVKGVHVRFIQIGGGPSEFEPILKSRQKMKGGHRLNKLAFAFTPLDDPRHPAIAWKDQEVTEAFIDWIKGIVLAVNANPIPDANLVEIIELAIPPFNDKDVSAEKNNLFSLDIKSNDAPQEAPKEAVIPPNADVATGMQVPAPQVTHGEQSGEPEPELEEDDYK